jgi:dihydroorotase-like cyclic amidohydrolase
VYGRLIKNLSKGYKQRVGFAQALIGNPPVLILDEPTVGLDPNQIIEIRTLIKMLGKHHTVILSSHILSEIEAVCDRIVIINEGKIVANDTPAELSANLSNDRRLIVSVAGPAKEIASLIEGIKDGTIDCIATDHAPHSAEEKSRGLEKSAFGIVGIETAFPLMYTYFVKTGIINIEKLIELMSINPCKIVGIDNSNSFATFDLNAAYIIDTRDFLSMGKATPFEGWEVYGKCIQTIRKGKVVFEA